MERDPVNNVTRERRKEKRKPFFFHVPETCADEWMLPAPCGWNGCPIKKRRKGNKDTRIEREISCGDVGGLSWLMSVHHVRFVDVCVGFFFLSRKDLWWKAVVRSSVSIISQGSANSCPPSPPLLYLSALIPRVAWEKFLPRAVGSSQRYPLAAYMAPISPSAVAPYTLFPSV